MRRLLAAAVLGLLQALVAALALRAGDAVVAVLAVAVVVAATSWVASWHATTDESGLALAGSGSALSLALVGRGALGMLLPLLTAQVVGAVLGGLAALALDGAADGVLVWDEPRLVVAAVAGLLVGVVATWATLAADGDGHLAWLAAPPVVAGALLGTGLAAAAQPAVLVGLAVAGLVGWPVALVAGAASLLGAALGAFALSWLTPDTE